MRRATASLLVVPRLAPLVEALQRGPRLSLGQARRPGFTTPIYANLFDNEGGETFSLIWSRGRRSNGD